MKLDKEKIKKEFTELVEKSNEVLNVEKNRQKIIASIYVVLSLAALSFFGLFAIGPTLVTVTELNKQFADNQQVLIALQNKNSNLQKLNAQYQQIQPDLDLLTKAIPQSPKVSVIFRQLETEANKNKLIVVKIDTGSMEIYPALKKNTPIFTFTFSISVRGEEKNVTDFIAEVINMDRIVSLDRLTMGKDQLGSFGATINGKAFFYKE